jgi:hypothetical protein
VENTADGKKNCQPKKKNPAHNECHDLKWMVWKVKGGLESFGNLL